MTKWCRFFHLKKKWTFWPKGPLLETVLTWDFNWNVSQIFFLKKIILSLFSEKKLNNKEKKPNTEI